MIKPEMPLRFMCVSLSYALQYVQIQYAHHCKATVNMQHTVVTPILWDTNEAKAFLVKIIGERGGTRMS